MAKTEGGWWMRHRKLIKLALLPLSLGWGIANRKGLLGEAAIGSEPYLGPNARAGWRDAISRSLVYLEYGAGGSTVEAIQTVSLVISVETDARFLAAVGRAVAKAGGKASFCPIHVNIGLTSKWGQPVFTGRSRQGLEKWRRYPSAPWAVLAERGLVPNFIFVDGRFRVASVLESFVRLPDGADCQFMLDDYKERKGDYSSILEFADQIVSLDSSLMFRRKQDFDREACRRALETAYADPL